jgi:pimeloyl-ACP methyl ester carboxylesterase
MTSTFTDSLELSDGRHLDVYVSGTARGTPLISHHGTPGSGMPGHQMERAAHARGLRLVTTSRPGYGTSSRHRGRRVADVVADTAEVLAWLGADRCLTAGASGGGPHALACAARLEGVAGCLVIAGVAPYGGAGLDWMLGMGLENVKEFGAALQSEGPLRTFLEATEGDFRTITAEGIIKALATVLPEVDKAVLTDEFGDDTASSCREAVRTSVDGWLDDDLALVQPWGFEPSEVTVPTMIWQGDLDLMVPFTHGQWLASAFPHASAHLIPGEGHLSLAHGALDAMLDELVAVL